MKKVYDKQCIKNEGGKPMEDIISKLAEIEATASHIMEDVSEQKKELAQQYEIAIRDFDQAVDDEMMAKNKEIRDELEIDMKAKLEKQKSDADRVLCQMETYYKERHTELAKQVYDRILRM